MTNRLTIIFIFLVLPCVFSSALILPEYFSPFHAPLYLVSVLASIPFLNVASAQLKKIVAWLVWLLFMAAIVSGLWVEDRQFAVNVRQWILYSSVYWCGLIGAIAFTMCSRISVRFTEQLLVLFLLLFCYGIYTYYAQLFVLPEFLYFLRPSPDLTVDNIHHQQFYGWASSARAYSVWYEPSFSAMVLACTLPLLYLSANKKVKVAFVFVATAYAYLTYSRSAWLVGVFFVFGHFTGLFRVKLSRVGLLLLALTVGTGITVMQIVLAGGYDEESSLIRSFSIINGILEWLENPLFGTGQAELLKPLELFNGVSHIHASIPAMLHWYGLLGLAIVLIPYWFISSGGSGRYNKAKTCFIYLTIIAINVGGALLMMSIFWFFWGLYMIQQDGSQK